MVKGYASQISPCPSGWSSVFGEYRQGGSTFGTEGGVGVCSHPDRYPYDQRAAYSATQFRLRGLETSGGEFGGSMFSINGLNQFYYLRDFFLKAVNLRL